MKTSKIVTSGAALTLAIFLGIAGVASAQNGDGRGPAGMGPGTGMGMGAGMGPGMGHGMGHGMGMGRGMGHGMGHGMMGNGMMGNGDCPGMAGMSSMKGATDNAAQAVTTGKK